ncbi:MAG TPA: hypothetical protein VHC22_24490 [Pirellulales bacterium]|nr:hypothetical protein [Pirellulales bacterium]
MSISINKPFGDAGAAGNVTSPVTMLSRFHAKAAMQVVLSGSLSAGTIALQGTLDGVNFDTANPLATFVIGTDSSGALKFVTDKPIGGYRAVVTGLTGTGAAEVLVAVDDMS